MAGKTNLTIVAVLITIGLFCAAFYLGGNSRAALAGRVIDGVGKPVPGAEIIIQRNEAETSISIWSNAMGEFRIGGLPTGEYRLQIQKKGFKPFQRRSVLLRPGGSAFVDAVVTREANASAGESASS
jgi:uncharacterized membrane protein